MLRQLLSFQSPSPSAAQWLVAAWLNELFEHAKAQAAKRTCESAKVNIPEAFDHSSRTSKVPD